MLTPSHPISILCDCLRVDLSSERKEELRAFLGSEQCPWEQLLYLANLHRVTLVWYLSLQRYDLAGNMPDDLRVYLDALLEENRERNSKLTSVLKSCLDSFSQEGIEVILLKGAAALADDLYGDNGARLMSDIDLLVTSEALDQVDKVLRTLGFNTEPEDEENIFFDQFHHLPPYHHAGLNIYIEIHTEITDFTKNKAFPKERLSSRVENLELSGQQVIILHGEDRLLHNFCHAMLQDGGWLNSWFSFHELVEWDRILRQKEVSLEEMLRFASEGNFDDALKVYAVLANQFFGSNLPEEWKSGKLVNDVKRFISGLESQGVEKNTPWVVRKHYLLNVLQWNWRTHHLSRQDVSLPEKLSYFLKLACKPGKWRQLNRN